MKKLIAIATVMALQATPAMAWVGGPWSSNTYDGRVTGIFGGMITMRNGSGIFRFSATETAQLGAFNSSMIYYKGVTYLGSCQADLDFEAKRVSGITNGSAYNRSPAATQNQSPPLNDNDPSYIPGAQTTNQTLTIQLSPAISGDEVEARTFQFQNNGRSGPIGIANTSWQGKITKTAPNIRFSAKGEAVFSGEAGMITRFTITEAEPLDPLDPGEDPILFIPGPVREISIDQGGNDPFPNPTNRVKIKVTGSRISYNVNPSLTSATTLQGTGGGSFSF